jgi:hypothetical protein
MKTHWIRFSLYDARMTQDISNRLIRVGPKIACFRQTDKQVLKMVSQIVDEPHDLISLDPVFRPASDLLALRGFVKNRTYLPVERSHVHSSGDGMHFAKETAEE